MNPIPESTINLIVSGLMGVFGGLFTVPINALISWWLKRNEQFYQHKLDTIAKQRELLLQHDLEMRSKIQDAEFRRQDILLQHSLETERQKYDKELTEMRATIVHLEERLGDG